MTPRVKVARTIKPETAGTCSCRPAAASPRPVPVALTASAVRPAFTAVLSLLLAFFPKCPVCWATYMSMFGGVWMAGIPYLSWLLPVLLVVSLLNLLLLLKRAPQRGYGPFLLGLMGVAVVLGGRSQWPQERWLLLIGMALMITSSLVSSFSFNRIHFHPHRRA